MGEVRSMGVLVAGVVLLAAGAAAQTAGTVVDEAAAGSAEATAAQDRIDVLADDAETLAAEYRATLQQTRALGVYARQLERLLVSQRAEIVRMEGEIENVTVVGRQVMPLMERMVDAFEAFVALDLPFLPEERQRRIRELRELMTRADVAVSERYRRLLEAFQAENEYGRTIEAYRGTLGGEGAAERTVDFLRVGRLGLFYQTLDGTECGRWRPETKAWEDASGYRASIEEGLAMARKQTAPSLLELPVPAPEVAE